MKKQFVLLALLSAAQTYAAQPIDSLKTVELQDVQVRSTRASKKTPMAFSDMDKRKIQQQNHGQDIPYLLSLTPSVTTTSDAGNGIGYTTLRVRGTAPERINITVNGVPMNDGESAQVYWVNMGDFASSVQSMQIQRGAGTSTNGAGAFGATLNMQTDNLGMKPYVGVELSGGSYYSNKQTVRFSTGMPDNGHWVMQGRLSHIGSKGYVDRAQTQLYNYFLQYGYMDDNRAVKLVTWNGEQQTYMAWDFASKYEQQLYGRTFNPCGDMTGNYDQFYSKQKDNYHQQNYQLLWTERFSRLLSLNAALHYTRGDGYYEQYKTGAKLKNYFPLTTSENGKKSDLIRRKLMGNDFYGVVASMVYDNHSNLEATVGGGWNRYDGDHFGHVIWIKEAPAAYHDNFNYYKDNAKKIDWNIYAKANYAFVPGLSAFLDLQYRHLRYKMQDPDDNWSGIFSKDYIIDEKFNFFNPKAGLNWEPANGHRLYASYAIAHKEPTRNDYEANMGLKLKAERLGDLEAGYKYLSPSFSAGANFYRMDYKDQFVLTGELNDIGEAVAINMPKSYRMGIEVEMAWKPVEWMRLDGNATWSKNRVKDASVTLDDGVTKAAMGDAPLSFSPEWIANGILTLTPVKGLAIAVHERFVDKQYLTNSGLKTMSSVDASGNATTETLMLGSHLVTNLDLSYNFRLPALSIKDATVGVMLYNLFSKKYDTNGWAAPSYRMNGTVVEAYNPNTAYGAVGDQWATGFAPSAPFNFMAHLALSF